jgi:hypothetical protein
MDLNYSDVFTLEFVFLPNLAPHPSAFFGPDIPDRQRVMREWMAARMVETTKIVREAFLPILVSSRQGAS